MRRISFVLIIALLLGCFTSCGGRKYNAEEVASAAEELIKKSEKLNILIWGEGLEASESEETKIGIYNRALSYSTQDYGVETVEDIKKWCRSVFTSSYSETIIGIAFSSVNDGNEIKLYARYYQKYSDINDTQPECIMVNTNYNYFLNDDVTYHYDTINVTHSKKETVFVNIDVTVTTKDGKSQRQTITVGLLEEANGWRLDSPTYTVYDDGSYQSKK